MSSPYSYEGLLEGLAHLTTGVRSRLGTRGRMVFVVVLLAPFMLSALFLAAALVRSLYR